MRNIKNNSSSLDFGVASAIGNNSNVISVFLDRELFANASDCVLMRTKYGNVKCVWQGARNEWSKRGKKGL